MIDRSDLRLVVYLLMHLLLMIPISLIFTVFSNERIIPISSLNVINMLSFAFIVFDLIYLILSIMSLKNKKQKSIELNQKIHFFQVNVQSERFNESTLASGWLGKNTHFEGERVYYLSRYHSKKRSHELIFVAEIKNFDYGNRTDSQLLALQEVLSQTKNVLNENGDTGSFKEITIHKVSHHDIHEKNYVLNQSTKKNEGFPIRDRIFIVFKTHPFPAKSRDHLESSVVENITIQFLEVFDNILKQGVKLLPQLPGQVVLSQWLQYFEHSYTNASQNQVILFLTLLDTYLHFSHNETSKGNPNLIAFKERLRVSGLTSLVDRLESYHLKRESFIATYLDPLLCFTLSTDGPSQLKVKQTIKFSPLEQNINNNGSIFEQKIAIYALVDYENFELDNVGFNDLFHGSQHDTVTISIEKQPFSQSASKELSTFRNRVFDRYHAVHGRFYRDGMKADDYYTQFIKVLKPLLLGNRNKTILRSYVIHKLKPSEIISVSLYDLFFNPQKTDYYFANNDGFTYRLLYDENMSFISRHLFLNYESDYLGAAGMITSPEILGYLGTFTQESNLNRYSLTSIYVGQDTQSQLPIMVDMSEYRLSNEAVGNANGHIVVIGKSGSGKTFLTKSLMFQKALEKNLYVFDIENEYNDFSNEKSELYALILEKEKQNSNNSSGINKDLKKDDIKRQRLYPSLSTTTHLSKEALIEKYVDNFDLMSTSRVINMFEIHYTDDQRKVIHEHPSKFIEQSQVYQKHRSFLIEFIKDLINVSSTNFDVEIGNCIDETYLDFYKNNHSGSIRGIDFNPNVYNPLAHMTQFPLFSDFKKVVEKRLNDLKIFEKNKFSQNHHYEFLYELDQKAALLLANQYWNDKFNQPSNVKLEKEIIIFNLKSLLNIAGVIPFSKWSLDLLLNFLFVTTFDKELDTKSIDSKGIFLVIDEAHRYLRPELINMIDFMADISKRGRKRYVEMCLVSQQISDFYRDSDSKELMQKARDTVKNAAYKFIFQVGSEFKDALQFIESGFQITEKDQTFIRQLYRGQCYFVQGPLELTKVNVKKDPRIPA